MSREAAVRAIEAQQKEMKQKGAAYWVGEQLKEMIRTGTEAEGAILAADLEQKGMGLADAEKKIAAYARAHKEGNCGVCPPWEAERILREFYGLGRAVQAAPVTGTQQKTISLLDFM